MSLGYAPFYLESSGLMGWLVGPCFVLPLSCLKQWVLAFRQIWFSCGNKALNWMLLHGWYAFSVHLTLRYITRIKILCASGFQVYFASIFIRERVGSYCFSSQNILFYREEMAQSRFYSMMNRLINISEMVFMV